MEPQTLILLITVLALCVALVAVWMRGPAWAPMTGPAILEQGHRVVPVGPHNVGILEIALNCDAAPVMAKLEEVKAKAEETAAAVRAAGMTAFTDVRDQKSKHAAAPAKRSSTPAKKQSRRR